ncbi:Tyrosine-protein kinase ptk [Posidoniimonas corsicana]|uniref:Tyrosine-protein kinase ptk n=1 Tax=Posidoniimonas corsicana TaxID=1938618 RepID=A0A5C5VCN9_9BACT|nr:CpsD/CapB family tyrosine-protein kinase [Posidoniimonas corsicana]TWT36356.1 Tyrosine-protein kinase ptk [Posidoniimonas corsicana]
MDPSQHSQPGASAARPTAGALDGSAASHRPGPDPYDAIVWRLRTSEANPGSGFVVGLLGCHRQCGATTIAANTGIRIASHSLGPVLLLDCNADRPQLSRSFNLASAPGLAEAASGAAELTDCIHATGVKGLDVMPSGALDTSLTLADQFSSLLSELRDEYAILLLDLPPADTLAGAVVSFAQAADAVLLVLRSQKTRRQAASGALSRLTQAGVPVVGSVVTRRKRFSPRWFGSGL